MDSLMIYNVVWGTNQMVIYIDAQKTVLDVACKFKLLYNDIDILTFQSNRFDVFMGKQSVALQFNLSFHSIQNISLILTFIDREGKVLCTSHNTVGFIDEVQNRGSSTIYATGTINPLCLRTSMNIRIGEVCFNIKTDNYELLNFCKDYLTDMPSEEFIELSAKDISFEKEEYIRIIGNAYISDFELESLALRRKISERILEHEEFQLHGAAVAVNNSAVIFTADSGVGKTTHVSLWLENLPEAFIVNGDHPIIKTMPQVSVCGSPWCGKEGMNTNTVVPLKAIVLMERNNQRRNIIRKISLIEALPELLKQVHLPLDSVHMKKTLELISSLNGKVDFYRFSFDNFTEDAFNVSYNALFG